MPTSFEALCALGDQANEMLGLGRFAEAEQAYAHVLAKHREGGGIDSFLLAKIVLGILLAKVRRGAVHEAHGIWIQGLDDQTLPGMGVHFIETGQTSTHDLITYFFISAYLHSMTPDPQQALAGVQNMMERILSYASERDPALFPMATSNYHAHLREIYEGQSIPEAAAAPLRRWTARPSAALQRGPIDFPAPSPWVIDWGQPGDEATVFTPDGEVTQAPLAPDGQADLDRAISDNGKKRIYRMLCNLAMSDGHVHPKERAILASVAKRFRLAADDVRSLEREGVAGKGLRVGKAAAERNFLFDSMIEVAAADGRLAHQEVKRLRAFAKLVKLPFEQVERRLAAKGFRVD